jgi:hypothetical protein
MRGHLARIDGIVRHCLETLVLGTEGDGVGLDRGIPGRRHRRDEARVQASAEKRGDRNICHEVGRYRLFEYGREVRGRTRGGR